VNGAMIKGKFIDETSTKLSHTIKDLNLLWVCRVLAFSLLLELSYGLVFFFPWKL
jgi:hypothetical protein